jgi:hypothetical protein
MSLGTACTCNFTAELRYDYMHVFIITVLAWKPDTNTKYDVQNQGKVAFESVGLSRAGTTHFLNPLSKFSTPAYDNSSGSTLLID